MRVTWVPTFDGSNRVGKGDVLERALGDSESDFPARVNLFVYHCRLRLSGAT